jgi:replication initiation protein RepC
MEQFATTPFGGGRFSAPEFLRRRRVETRRQAVGQGGNDTGTADKWQLIRALSEARARFGLSDRAICVLEALLSFHQSRELDGKEPIIVFPSNAELSLRSRSMADATLRRHIAALVEAGLILRRDSPNGKRYCRRGTHGEIESAFGFDLSPLALAANAIHAAAEEVRAHNLACQKLRAEITVHLRDTGKVIAAAMEEGRGGPWEAHAMALAPLCARLPRQADLSVLGQRLDAIKALRKTVEADYLCALSEQELSGNDDEFERHYQNSKTDQPFDKGSDKELKREGRGQTDSRPQAVTGRGEGLATEPARTGGAGRAQVEGVRAETGRPPETKSEPVPLSYLKSVCPSLQSYARDGISDWRDVKATADLVRSMLGISPDAWRVACQAMGETGAAITIAAILERAEAIRSPGGYLRALSERALAGKFSVRPMLAALENR